LPARSNVLAQGQGHTVCSSFNSPLYAERKKPAMREKRRKDIQSVLYGRTSPHPHIKAGWAGFIVVDFLQVEYLTSQSQNPGIAY